MAKKASPVNKYIPIIGLVLLVIIVAVLVLRPDTANEQRNSRMLTTEGDYEVVAQPLSYYENANGYLARPKEEGNYPGIIMIHEWWGLNDNIKEMADKLASHGYVVLAVDLYNGKVATTPQEARNYTSSLNQTEAIANMNAAKVYLEANHKTDKMATLGWCFGGGQSLRFSLADGPLDATVIYYGNLVTNETQLASLDWPVLGIFGANDTSIPVTTVQQFDAALDNLNVENEIYIYPGVGHAFANPSGMNYAPDETKDAWEKTLAFLEKHLKD